jgi:hypothetical protein
MPVLVRYEKNESMEGAAKITNNNPRNSKRLTDTQRFRNESNFAFGANFNTKLAKLDNWTRFLAFLIALLWFTLG